MAGFGSAGAAQPPARDQGAAELPLLRALAGAAGGDAVLRLAGEIDLVTAPAVSDAVDQCLRDRPARLSIDLRGVTFCDCAGARSLRRARQQAAAAGASVRITALTPPVRRILTLLKAGDLLGVAVYGTPATSRAPAASPQPGSGAEPDAAPPVPPPAPSPDAAAGPAGS